MPQLQWTLGSPGWRPLQWQALHNAFRLTLSHGEGNLAPVDWGRLILEPYQLVPLQRIENLPFPRILLADDTGLGKTAEAGLILFRLRQKRRADRILILCRARPELKAIRACHGGGCAGGCVSRGPKGGYRRYVGEFVRRGTERVRMLAA